MKHLRRIVMILLVGGLIASASVALAQNGNGGNGNGGDNPCTTNCDRNGNRNGNQNRPNRMMNNVQSCAGDCLNQLPAANPDGTTGAVEAAMVAVLMDEYQAYALYGAVIEQFGELRPFVNIQRAEAQHADAMLALFERYDVVAPEMPDVAVPTFETVSNACSVLADAEIANFEMYDASLEVVADYPDIVAVMTNLRNASEFNHLPALERCAN